MKIKFEHQQFQADAARAVVTVFEGQPPETSTYMMDRGVTYQPGLYDDIDFQGTSNYKIVPSMTDERILENLQKVQRENNIKPSDKLEGRQDGFNLTIEMETGVGKTYTYIKTIFELNLKYGWTKFIVVVPSIAIREGVYKTFEMTREHFRDEYDKQIKFFIYNSSRLNEIDDFARDAEINVMIINSQAFSSQAKAARRIYMELDEFRSRRPIDIIAKTNPIIIIDEPQSVEGQKTKEALKKFNPLLTLRYSATHRADNLFNMVYRLDALDAFKQKLVKKITVKGIAQIGCNGTSSYLYLEGINVSNDGNPTATLSFDIKRKNGIGRTNRKVCVGDNLYYLSSELSEYNDRFVVTHIDGKDNYIEFENGIKLYAGEANGDLEEDQIRRIQIRETILAHIEKERKLFKQGIKVLSLFFIDEVSNYREYDDSGQPMNGKFAKIFEEEYSDILSQLQLELDQEEYLAYLESIEVSKTHEGYFSIDKKGKMVNCDFKKTEGGSSDVSAYELIMKNKELLLNQDPKKSPVRFIFSHSALKEGWDNPNVFQICTLKQSSSDVRKRQEVGRGLRLCVNQSGERMDVNRLGDSVYEVNELTVVASESYESFVNDLQSELAEALADRPRVVTYELFVGMTYYDAEGNKQRMTKDAAVELYNSLVKNNYIDDHGKLTDVYYDAKENGTLSFGDYSSNSAAVQNRIDTIYDPKRIEIEDARSANCDVKQLDEDTANFQNFKEIWDKISCKSIYSVVFDESELIQNCVNSLNKKLTVSKVFIHVESGSMKNIDSKDDLLSGSSFEKEEVSRYAVDSLGRASTKYDLIGKLVESTQLKRSTIIAILKKLDPRTFNLFRSNPEEFIQNAAELIKNEMAIAVIQHIEYRPTEEQFSEEIFRCPGLKGKIDINALKVEKSIYDHVIYDSSTERKFAEDLEESADVVVYVKLPNAFYIPTPVGNYNPDWAIRFKEKKGLVEHIYFVAETKGSMDSMQLRPVEQSKIDCATKHFEAISQGEVVYKVTDNFEGLLGKISKMG